MSDALTAATGESTGGLPHKRQILGRPKLPKGEAKSEMVRARVTPSELSAIEKAANGDGISEWARAVMLSAAGQTLT